MLVFGFSPFYAKLKSKANQQKSPNKEIGSTCVYFILAINPNALWSLKNVLMTKKIMKLKEPKR